MPLLVAFIVLIWALFLGVLFHEPKAPRKMSVLRKVRIPSGEASKGKGVVIFFQTETSGLFPQGNPDFSLGLSPRLLRLSWVVCDLDLNVLKQESLYVDTDCPVSSQAQAIHRIAPSDLKQKGLPIAEVLYRFACDLTPETILMAFNYSFHEAVIRNEVLQLDTSDSIRVLDLYRWRGFVCLMNLGRMVCELPASNGDGYKTPTMTEMVRYLLGGAAEELLQNSREQIPELLRQMFVFLVKVGLVEVVRKE